jgi:hypothetical protein
MGMNRQGENECQLKMSISQNPITHLSSRIAEKNVVLSTFKILTKYKPNPFKRHPKMSNSNWMTYQQAMNGSINTSHEEVAKGYHNSSK